MSKPDETGAPLTDAAAQRPRAASRPRSPRGRARPAAKGFSMAAILGYSTALITLVLDQVTKLYTLFVYDLPVKDGKVRPEIVAKWVANAPLEMLDKYADNLKKYYSIGIEVGTKDSLLRSNQQLHEALVKLNVRHGYEEYDGDHTNKVGERIERSVLPFFSKNLASPANPTSPAVQH